MIHLEIRLELPKGELPEGADLAGFERRVAEELKAIETKAPFSSVCGPEKKPAPSGTAGAPGLVTWAVQFAMEHPDETALVLKSLLAAISTAVAFFKLRGAGPAREEKSGDVSVKARNSNVAVANVTINVGGDLLVLPATSDRISKIAESAVASDSTATGEVG